MEEWQAKKLVKDLNMLILDEEGLQEMEALELFKLYGLIK